MTAMELISRAEAKRRGMLYYFTGEPCPRGHIGKRRVSKYDCVACKRGGYRGEIVIQRDDSECKICGTAIPFGHATCSLECRAELIRIKKNLRYSYLVKNKICPNCGAGIRMFSKWQRKYCSENCRKDAASKSWLTKVRTTNRNIKDNVWGNCVICRVLFIQKSLNHKYCSMACYNTSQRESSRGEEARGRSIESKRQLRVERKAVIIAAREMGVIESPQVHYRMVRPQSPGGERMHRATARRAAVLVLAIDILREHGPLKTNQVLSLLEQRGAQVPPGESAAVSVLFGILWYGGKGSLERRGKLWHLTNGSIVGEKVREAVDLWRRLVMSNPKLTRKQTEDLYVDMRLVELRCLGKASKRAYLQRVDVKEKRAVESRLYYQRKDVKVRARKLQIEKHRFVAAIHAAFVKEGLIVKSKGEKV